MNSELDSNLESFNIHFLSSWTDHLNEFSFFLPLTVLDGELFKTKTLFSMARSAESATAANNTISSPELQEIVKYILLSKS